MRHVVIHYHVFKNAGSTIDAILQKNFSPNCGEIEGQTRATTLNAENLLNYVLQNQRLKAISSHQARLPAPTHPDIAFYPIIFLRHPIDRIGSVHLFARKQPESPSITAKLARENNLADYIKLLPSYGASVLVSNNQTVQISGRLTDMRKAVATTVDLKQAKQRLSELAFLGIVEYFDESLLLMQNFLFDTFGVLNLSYTVKNKSAERKLTLEERLDEIETEIGASLYQELLEKNTLDLELYEYALRLFKNRIVNAAKEKKEAATKRRGIFSNW